MALPPLTHHDIIELVAPFSRRGFEVDLAASRRDERRLLFRPREADGASTVLQLDDLGGGRLRLTRTLRHADGLEATLRTQGADPAALLARVEAVPAARHFAAGPGLVIARHYTMDGAAAPVLARGVVRVPGLELTLVVPATRGIAADLTLLPSHASRPALPEDLLAVLGWDWARLVADRRGWTTKLRLRGDAARRTRQGEAALDLAAAHLARTLAEPPAQYHARLRGARWRVFCRRGIPTFTALGLVATVLVTARLDWQPSTTTMVLMYHVPTLLVALSFVLQELPRFEFPPWPRRLKAASWFDAGAAAAPSALGTQNTA